MADRYWIGNGGNWTDTAHWSDSSGGSGGFSVPTSADDVYFDTNSITVSSQKIIDDTVYDLSVNNITFSNSIPFNFGSGYKLIFGSYTYQGTTYFTCSGGFVFLLLKTPYGPSDLNDIRFCCRSASASLSFAPLTFTLSSFSTQGNNRNRKITLQSLSPGNPFTLSIASNNVYVHNTTIIDSIATGGALFCSLTDHNNIDGGGNTGWIFTGLDRYWVNNGGIWNSTVHWSTSSGGTSGASVPRICDNVIFDENSITLDNETITLMGSGFPTLNFTNILHNPILNIGRAVIYGSLILKSGMTVTGWATPDWDYTLFRGYGSIQTNGVPITGNELIGGYADLFFGYNCDYVFEDDLITNCIELEWGTFSFQGDTVTLIGSWPTWMTLWISEYSEGYNSYFIDMGTCDLIFDISTAPASATDVGMEFYEDYTIRHNNITFRGTCEGTPLPTVLIEMWDNKESQRVSAGIVTFEEPVYLEIGGLDDIRFTVEDFIFSGTAEQQAYIEGGGDYDWWMMKESGDVNVYYTTISYSQVSGGANWNSFLSRGNIDDGYNIGWIWGAPSTIITNIGTDVSTHGFTAHGEITDTGGENASLRGFCLIRGTDGIPTEADNINYEEGDFGLGSYSLPITDLDERDVYLFRAYAVNSLGTFYGDVLPIGMGGDYTFENVQDNHTIQIIYSPISTDHTITATAITSGGTGTIDPSGNVIVSYQNDKHFDFTIDPPETPPTPFSITNYLGDVLVDTESVGTSASYDFYNVVENHTIDAIFTLFDDNTSWKIDSYCLSAAPILSAGIYGFTNDEEYLYILDTYWVSPDQYLNRVWVYTINGEYIADWPTGNYAPPEFAVVIGLAVDDTHAYIGNWHYINVYEKLTGTYTTTITAASASGGYDILSMCISPDKQYLYSCFSHGRIAKLKISDYSIVWDVTHYGTGDGQFDVCWGIQADENYVYVTDIWTNKIVRYNASDGSYTTDYDVWSNILTHTYNITTYHDYLLISSYSSMSYHCPYVWDKNMNKVGFYPLFNGAIFPITADQYTTPVDRQIITATNQYVYALYKPPDQPYIWMMKIYVHVKGTFTVESLCDYATLGGTGSISPSGYMLVENNDTYTLDVTVDASNMAWVYLDGINTGWTAYNETKTYTLSNVTDNHHITVRFGGV